MMRRRRCVEEGVARRAAACIGSGEPYTTARPGENIHEVNFACGSVRTDHLTEQFDIRLEGESMFLLIVAGTWLVLALAAGLGLGRVISRADRHAELPRS
jgi:hypothetical protein